MRLYMVRRTRSFIMQHYAHEDARGKYLQLADGSKSYFPNARTEEPEVPHRRQRSDGPLRPVLFDQRRGDHQCTRIAALRTRQLSKDRAHADSTASAHRRRSVARWHAPNGLLPHESVQAAGICRPCLPALHRATHPTELCGAACVGKRAGHSSGTQGAELLDTRYYDEDPETSLGADDDNGNGEEVGSPDNITGLRSESAHKAHAAKVYAAYAGPLKSRFKWLPAAFFTKDLAKHLKADARSLLEVLGFCGEWNPEHDAKLAELVKFIGKKHSKEKVLVFTQFADTARYLKAQLVARGIKQIEEATGQSVDPTALAWRFSPESSGKRDRVRPADELRVLIATDVLSEGQNLQDCAVIVNYDLPWAIIRLIQRAGRVDRIGQKAAEILCYSFVPADGVERLIRLRARVRQRLIENAEVVGSDEAFFDDDKPDERILDLYNEKSSILDDDGDTEVDLASYAYQIWKNACDADPSLAAKIEAMPNVVYATKGHAPTPEAPTGVLVYLRTGQGNDALSWIDESGKSVTQSQLTILKAAACAADTPALPRAQNHHELTARGMQHIVEEEKSSGGALGRPSGARFKTYERLKRYRQTLGERRDLFMTDAHVLRDRPRVGGDLPLSPLSDCDRHAQPPTQGRHRRPQARRACIEPARGRPPVRH